MSSNPLIGTWRLHSFHLVDANHVIQDSLGSNPIGYLIYTADGFMSVHMMSSNREQISQEDLREASPQDKAKLVDTYRGYAGTYRIEGNKVIHHVQVGIASNWTGTEMIRYFELNGNRLTLKAAQPLPGKDQIPVLVWEKISLD